jgi:hypothetical protein
MRTDPAAGGQAGPLPGHPGNVLHCFATHKDDPTEQPRWGKIGQQEIVDEGPLPPTPNPAIEDFKKVLVNPDARPRKSY